MCELQGGWFSTVGGGLSEDSYLDGRHARGMALMAMAGGSTGLNYYMFFNIHICTVKNLPYIKLFFNNHS